MFYKKREREEKIKSKYPAGAMFVFLVQGFFNFSFYGLKGLFVLYMTQHKGMATHDVLGFFAALMSLSYATSLFGGMMADKFLGARYTLLMGGMLSTTGVMFFLFSYHPFLFYLSLSFLSLGSGLCKPNISASLALLLKDQKDPRRDTCFMGLYMAMNLGSLCGPVICGILATYVSWSASIVLIASGFMVGSLIFFTHVKAHQKFELSKKQIALVGFFTASAAFILWFLFYEKKVLNYLMAFTAIGSLFLMAFLYGKGNVQEKRGIGKALPVIVLFSFFCSLYEQSGTSIVLFLENHVNREVGHYMIPATSVLSLGPVLVFIFGIWASFFLDKYLFKTGIYGKLFLGFLCIALSFSFLAGSLLLFQEKTPLLWVVLFFIFQTFGEILIFPVGYAYVSQYAPQKYLSLFMSFWLVAIAYGHYVAGFLAKFSLNIGQEGQGAYYYSHFFLKLSILSLLGCAPFLWKRFKK